MIGIEHPNALERALVLVISAFSEVSGASVFFLKSALASRSAESEAAMDSLYSGILKTFDTQQELAESIVEALQLIRRSALEDKSMKGEIEAQLNLLVEYTAMVDYCTGVSKDKFLGFLK